MRHPAHAAGAAPLAHLFLELRGLFVFDALQQRVVDVAEDAAPARPLVEERYSQRFVRRLRLGAHQRNLAGAHGSQLRLHRGALREIWATHVSPESPKFPFGPIGVAGAQVGERGAPRPPAWPSRPPSALSSAHWSGRAALRATGAAQRAQQQRASVTGERPLLHALRPAVGAPAVSRPLMRFSSVTSAACAASSASAWRTACAKAAKRAACVKQRRFEHGAARARAATRRMRRGAPARASARRGAARGRRTKRSRSRAALGRKLLPGRAPRAGPPPGPAASGRSSACRSPVARARVSAAGVEAAGPRARRCNAPCTGSARSPPACPARAGSAPSSAPSTAARPAGAAQGRLSRRKARCTPRALQPRSSRHGRALRQLTVTLVMFHGRLVSRRYASTVSSDILRALVWLVRCGRWQGLRCARWARRRCVQAARSEEARTRVATAQRAVAGRTWRCARGRAPLFGGTARAVRHGVVRHAATAARLPRPAAASMRRP